MERNHNNAPVIDPNKCIVFFDFDNTITTCDVFDDMLLRFPKDERWFGTIFIIIGIILVSLS